MIGGGLETGTFPSIYLREAHKTTHGSPSTQTINQTQSVEQNVQRKDNEMVGPAISRFD